MGHIIILRIMRDALAKTTHDVEVSSLSSVVPQGPPTYPVNPSVTPDTFATSLLTNVVTWSRVRISIRSAAIVINVRQINTIMFF